MSNVNNLTSKILEEAKTKSGEILKAAQEEEAKIIEKKVAEATEIEKEYIGKANAEAVTKRERVISGAELKIRNEKLSAKQAVVERVFQEAISKLNALSDEEVLKFIRNSIVNMDVAGDEKLIVSKNFRDRISESFLKELNEALEAKGKMSNITLGSEAGNFGGGFILEKKGIEINNTFEALIQSMKDELEYEVARVLFS